MTSLFAASLKNIYAVAFHIKDLGVLKYFLGLELARGPSSMFICQRKYTLDILKECKMLDCKPASFPMEENHKLALDSGPSYSDHPCYRRLVGRIIYLTISHPEITYSVHILSQFMQSPQQAHWNAAICVLTKKQQGDIFTKALGSKSFQELTVKLGAHNPHTST